MELSLTAQSHATGGKEQDTFQLVALNPTGTAVLLETHDSEYSLPTIHIPKFTRPAHEITTALRDTWGLPVVLLFTDVITESVPSVHFAVIEVQDGIHHHPPSMQWFTIHHALFHLLLEDDERRTLKSSYVKATSRIRGDHPGPFAKLGWMLDLQDWIGSVIRPLGMELKDFEQLNGSETSTLLRFLTTQGPVWFKAVGKPNLHEYSISEALAKLFPSHVPNILATKSDWHGWLMSDGGGVPLDELEDLSAWQTAVASLAGLQIESVGTADRLLKAGCRDLRVATLLEMVDPFLEVMTDLMQQQTKAPPPILTHQELSDLNKTLKDSLHRLATLQIPDTLGHSDFNPGNIIVAPEGCTFIDWAEAHVGNPFLTFEYLGVHLRRDYPALVRFEDAIRSAYSQRWQEMPWAEHLSEAFLLSPLVAVFAYAVAGNVWRTTERMRVPGFPGFLRKLTRRLKQEVDSIQRRGN